MVGLGALGACAGWAWGVGGGCGGVGDGGGGGGWGGRGGRAPPRRGATGQPAPFSSSTSNLVENLVGEAGGWVGRVDGRGMGGRVVCR